jgi:hypothetical protein
MNMVCEFTKDRRMNDIFKSDKLDIDGYENRRNIIKSNERRVVVENDKPVEHRRPTEGVSMDKNFDLKAERKKFMITVDNKESEIKTLKKEEEIDFDNCNVYLKSNKPDARKRSALKFLEDSLKDDKKETTNSNNISSHNYSNSPDLRNKHIDTNPTLEFGSRRNRPTNINEALENSIKNNSVINTPSTNKENIVDSRRRKNFNI